MLKQRVLQGCELDAAQREKLGREDELFTALEEALDVAEAAVAVPQTGPGSPQKSEVSACDLVRSKPSSSATWGSTASTPTRSASGGFTSAGRPLSEEPGRTCRASGGAGSPAGHAEAAPSRPCAHRGLVIRNSKYVNTFARDVAV